MRILAAFACAVMLFCLGIAPGHADKRVALVVGNSTYSKVPQLPNPANDASAIAAMFRDAGFDVVQAKTNLDLASMRRALRDFTDVVRDADMVVVFYAGHGIEVGGTNYLIPVDATLERDIDAEDEAVSLDRVSQLIEPAKQFRLIILDACRDNPFASGMKRTVANRSIGRGLARIEPTSDTLIAFAARAGSTAADGVGPNSPYTTALLQHLMTPGLDVSLALRRVRDQVIASTGGKQSPFVYGSLGGAEVSLVRKVTVEPVPPAGTPQPSEAAQAWAVTQNTTSIAVLEEFIRRFSDSYYAVLARARLEELKKVAAVAPPVQPAPPSATAPKAAVGVFPEAQGATPLTSERERALKPKDVFKECDKCPEMVVVPAGSFMMGSGEAGRPNDEGPRHSVNIAKSFAIGKIHVTIDEFAAFVAETGYPAGSKCGTRENGKIDQREGRSWRNPGFVQAGSHPAVCLNWNDAKAYVAWLAKKTSKAYRLPSEAEFEYAARAGTTTAYWWGDAIGQRNANCSRCGSEWDDKRTAPAGSFAPNAFGLYDVNGNAAQRLEDCHQNTYAGAPSDGSAWVSGTCAQRVVRGGSWVTIPWVLTSTYRTGWAIDVRDNGVGFRVARTLTQ